MQDAGATLGAVHEEHVVEHTMNADAHEDVGSGSERTFAGLLARRPFATHLLIVTPLFLISYVRRSFSAR
jgi:hypothetical protein